MQNKKLILVMGTLLLLVGVAAFIGGTLLNRRIDPMGLGGPFGGEDLRSIVLPAPELPTTSPEVTGPFVEQRDNSIMVETKSLEAGGMVPASDTKNQSGPQVEQ